MSNWQSFFNQLAKPVNQGKISTSTQICFCSKGALIFNKNLSPVDSYSTHDKCSLTATCCTIQVDKHRARAYYNTSATIDKTESFEVSILNKKNSELLSFDEFIR